VPTQRSHLTNEPKDLHSDNLLIALTNDAVLTTVENQEFSTPSARKQIGDIIIYVSRYMMGGPGPLVICDFGQARIGNEHTGNAMPVQYRAPEVILNMKWGNAVDMWSVGLLVRNLPSYFLMVLFIELNSAIGLGPSRGRKPLPNLRPRIRRAK
jgi:serine/threonine protein kinase